MFEGEDLYSPSSVEKGGWSLVHCTCCRDAHFSVFKTARPSQEEGSPARWPFIPAPGPAHNGLNKSRAS